MKFDLTSSQVELLKWLALIAMVADHIGAVFYDRSIFALTAVGRIALPLFALSLAYGASRSQNLSSLAVRLCCVAVVAQLFYIAAFGIFTANVLFTFLLGVLIVSSTGLSAVVAVVCALALGQYVEGAWFAIAVFVSAFYYFREPNAERACWLLVSVASMFLVNGNQFALLSLVVLFVVRFLDVSIPRIPYFFYAFYPAHLAVLAVFALAKAL